MNSFKMVLINKLLCQDKPLLFISRKRLCDFAREDDRHAFCDFYNNVYYKLGLVGKYSITIKEVIDSLGYLNWDLVLNKKSKELVNLVFEDEIEEPFDDFIFIFVEDIKIIKSDNLSDMEDIKMKTIYVKLEVETGEIKSCNIEMPDKFDCDKHVNAELDRMFWAKIEEELGDFNGHQYRTLEIKELHEIEWLTYSLTCGFNIVMAEDEQAAYNGDCIVIDKVKNIQKEVIEPIRELIKEE